MQLYLEEVNIQGIMTMLKITPYTHTKANKHIQGSMDT